jgi:hypothetical protein
MAVQVNIEQFREYLCLLWLEETGQQMDRTEGAVAALIYRGTRRLRELLGALQNAGKRNARPENQQSRRQSNPTE